MQSKGAIKFVAIIIALACLYQLSFTVVTKLQERKAAVYAEQAIQEIKKTPDYSKVSEWDQAYFLDSLRNVKTRFYTDSISSEKVYLGFTYKQVKEKEISLGLDLKGGMNVMLEVKVEELVRALSDYNQDPQFNEAIALANKNQQGSRTDFITLFEEAWNQVAPGERLAKIFGTYEMRERIKPETTNEEIIKILHSEAESALSNSFNVLRNRIDRFGVFSPNIQRLGTTGRILVELPGVKEPDRVRKLLQGTASLEFWETYENSEIVQYLEEVNAAVRDMTVEETPENAADQTVAAADAAKPAGKEAATETVADSSETALDSLAEDELQIKRETDEQEVDREEWAKENPFFNLLNPNFYQGQAAPGPCIGRAHYRDTALIGSWLRDPKIQNILPQDLRPLWSVKAIDSAGVYFELIAIKVNTRDGRAPLDGGSVTDARKNYSNTTGAPEVDMGMNAQGAQVWARMTADNIGKSIAIVLDDMVYSYPRVNNEITGGRSTISGNFTSEEADDLANVLKSGKLPAPAVIVQESVVGPTLGSESIRSGFISFVIAFIFVLLYMLFFYAGAGVAANVALICNALFLFGTLVSFGAVLTLPGMAGIVLTLGMAVDANVIIYERIKEEFRGGKALRLAVSEGYRNAYSAIIDGNVTTLLTGLILMLFGSGPVKGFATTLVIGIITSLVTSIFITRLIFEARLSRGKNIRFDNKLTRNFLQNTHIDFIKLRKTFYIVSACALLIGIAFIFTKGFSYGIDFSGGRTYVVRFDREVTSEDIRNAVFDEFTGGVEVKEFGGNSQMKITTQYKIEDNSAEVDKEVDTKLYNALKGFFVTPLSFEEFTSTVDNPNGIINSEKVGPTVAEDIKRDALIAVALSLIGIFLYIAARFRKWVWGLGGVLCLTHDALLVISFFAIFSGILPFNLDIDQQFIAAILTIIGYSINDTVVIFDRIREYRTLYPKRELYLNINDALNSTLARTLNTSLSTLIVLIAIAIFGGEVVRGMVVALIVGVLVGTYSSLFLASTFVYDIYKKREARQQVKKVVKAKK